MLVSQFKASLPALFAARVTPLLWGQHGIGKSSAPQQWCDENGHKMFNLRLGNMEVGDLLGLADFEVDQYTGKKTATRFFMPDWMKEVCEFATANPDKYAVIFLDEINRVRKDMLAPVFQIALDFRLHTYVFPSNVRVLAAANPPTDDYDNVLDIRDLAFLDRFCHIDLNTSAVEFLSYGEKKGLNKDVLAYVRDNPEFLQGTVKPFSVDEYCKPSPRTWEAVSRLIEAGAPQELLYGMLGSTTTASFKAYLARRKEDVIEITLEDILKRGDKKKTLDKVRKAAETGQHAMLAALNDQLNKHYVDMGENEAEDAEVARVIAYVKALPIELAMAFLYTAPIRAFSCAEKFGFNEDLIKWLDEKLASGEAQVLTPEQLKAQAETTAEAADKKGA